MYFLVNSQNYIVAASNDFMQQLNSREFYRLSSMLKDKLIQIDEEKNKIKINNMEFNFSKTTMHSCFGDVILFHVYEVKESLLQTEDDSNVEFLRQIKQKAIEKEDNEFEIPTIPSLQKEKEETPKEEELIKEIESIKVLDQEPQEKIEEKEDKTQSLTLSKSKEEKVSKELFNKEQMQEAIEKITPSINLEEIKEIAPTKKSLTPPPLSDEIIKASLEEEKMTPPLVEKLEVPELSSKELEAPTLEEKKINESVRENETLQNFNEKLIQIDTKKEETSLDKKLEEKLEFEEESPFLKELEEIEVKKEKEESKKEEFIPLVTPKDFETKEKSKKETLQESVQEEKKKTIPLVTPEYFKETKEKTLSPLKEEQVKKEKVLITPKDFEKKEETKEKETIEQKKTLTPSKIEQEKEVSEQKAQGILSFSIDLEKNASSLKIDINTYKMLLKSFLGEVENNYNKIEQGDENIIKMLIDAGNLLALKDLSNLLHQQNLTPSKNNFEKIQKYIEHLYDEINTSKKVKVQEISTEKEVTQEEVDESLIDITSDEELFKLIKPKDAEFDPKEVEEELGLPLDLIGNFIQDFIIQAKEHLPIFIEAYQERNLEELRVKAHMLKGAASNLRIKAIANTLRALEESSDFDNIAAYIKDFVGEIKGLELDYEKLFLK